MNEKEIIISEFEEILYCCFSVIFLLILLLVLIKESPILHSIYISIKYRSNPNNYLRKILKENEEPKDIIANFLYAFAFSENPYSNIFTDSRYKKEKDRYINGFRYLLGLINLDFFDEEKTKNLISIVFNHLWRAQNDHSVLYHWQKNKDVSLEDANMIIWDWQLIDTKVERYLNLHNDYLIFKNVSTGNIKEVDLIEVKNLKMILNSCS